jgi:anti-sigma regulatory factor (Ser/Thr protein kinase)
MPAIACTIRLASTPAAPAAARAALAWLEPHVEAARYANLRVAVTELVANAVEHGGDGVDDVVDVAIRLDEHSARVDVADAGRHFTPALPAPPPALDSRRGRGLFLVERLSDRCGVAAPAHLWVEVDRDGRDATLAP